MFYDGHDSDDNKFANYDFLVGAITLSQFLSVVIMSILIREDYKRWWRLGRCSVTSSNRFGWYNDQGK